MAGEGIQITKPKAPTSTFADAPSLSKRVPTKMRIILEDDLGIIEERTLVGTPLRYGENPNQRAVIFAPPENEQKELMGRKPVSFNNEGDLSHAFALVEELDRNLPLLRATPGEDIVAIIKHGSPCGLAVAPNQQEAYRRAFATDMDAAFGGIIATNRIFQHKTMEAIVSNRPVMNGEQKHGHFVEVIVAPDFEPGVVELMQSRSKSTIRLIPLQVEWTTGRDRLHEHFALRSLPDDRVLLQDPDHPTWGSEVPWEVVSKRQPTDRESDDMVISWVNAKHVLSNAVTFALDGRLVAVAGGQPRRSDAAWIGGERAKEDTKELEESGLDLSGIRMSLVGSAMATDGFHPFSDTLTNGHKYGATASISPRGGKKADEVTKVADELDMAMAVTEKRVFRH